MSDNVNGEDSLKRNGQWWKSWLGIQSTPFNMKQKDYHKPGYWKDWYWNKGGREKVQETRYIAEYERERRSRSHEECAI